MNIIRKINEKISLFLNFFARNYNLQKIIWIFADLPIFFAPVFLVSAWIYFAIKNNDNKKKDLIFIFFSILFSLLTNLVIQHLVIERRPETFIKPLIDHLPDASFPSDHAVVSFSFLAWLYLFWYKRVFWIYLPFVIVMNICRISAGVHWFFDVIVWMFIGIFWAFLFKKYSKNKVFDKIANFFIKIAKFFML